MPKLKRGGAVSQVTVQPNWGKVKRASLTPEEEEVELNSKKSEKEK